MPTAVGIDIGSEAIKGIVLNVSRKGLAEVVAAGTLPLGELGHMEDSQDKALALGVKLKQLVRDAGLRGRYRRLGASGKATSIRYVQVPPVPPWRLDMLVKYEVEEKSGDKDKNTFDFQILDVPEAGGQYTIMIGTLKEAAAIELLALGRAAGLGEAEIDLEAQALYNAYYHGHGFDNDKTVLVADIGADDVTVLLCHNGGLYFARTVPGAGRRFTQVLAEELKIELAEAETVKTNQAEISFDMAAQAGRSGRYATRTGVTGVVPRASGTATIQRGSAPQTAKLGLRTAPPAGGTRSIPAASASAPAQENQEAAAKAGTSPSAPNPQAADDPGAGLPEVVPNMPEETSRTGESKADDVAGAAAKAGASPCAPKPPAAHDSDEAPPTVFAKTPLELLQASQASAAAAASSAPIAQDDASAAAKTETGSSGPKPPAAGDPGLPQPNYVFKMPNGSAQNGEAPAPGVNGPSAGAAVPRPDSAAASKVVPVPDTPEERRKRQMSNVLLREAAALCATLENAVLVCKQQTKMREIKVDRLYVTGGGSRLKGLGEFISRRMRVEVMPLEPFRQISLDRLAPEQAAALRSEQHTLAVATGLALGSLQKNTLSFLLWPEAVKQRKAFWSRGAYLYYAAALAVIGLAVFLFTPYRNTQALVQNFTVAEEAYNDADVKYRELKKMQADYDEKHLQLKQIADNTLSGHYFLKLLAELKNKYIISDDIYLTQISTSIPQQVIRAAEGEGGEGGPGVTPPPAPGTPRSAARAAGTDPNATADTFQTQRVVYLRGFARSKKKDQGDDRILRIMEFYKRLAPHLESPDDPSNLFKDMRPIWISPDDLKVVREDPDDPKKNEDWFLTEFILEAYSEGTRERTDKKPPAKTASTIPVAPAAGTGAPVVAPLLPAAVAPLQPAAQPQAAPAAAPAAPAAAPAVPEDAGNKPKKKKYTQPSDQPQPVQPGAAGAPATPAPAVPATKAPVAPVQVAPEKPAPVAPAKAAPVTPAPVAPAPKAPPPEAK
ncbi:MAG: pilus assembly protein PilM [Planctomycetota bacterium]